MHVVAIFLPISSILVKNRRRVGINLVYQISGRLGKAEVVGCDPLVGEGEGKCKIPYGYENGDDPEIMYAFFEYSRDENGGPYGKYYKEPENIYS